MARYSSLLFFILGFYSAWSQSTSQITDIRLAGRSGSFYGRVEIQYNGTWGTICDNYWGYPDANVACRMLGFVGAECGRPNAYFGQASSSVSILMDRVRCTGSERFLDHCPYLGLETRHYCTRHRDDASVVCQNTTLFSVPTLTVVNTTTRTITVSWRAITSPVAWYRQRYRIQYNATGSFPSYIYYTPRSGSRGPYYASLLYLQRDAEYSISIRLEGASTYCGYYSNYNMYSSYSTPTTARTNSTARPSNFNIRLISPVRGLNFLGRVELNFRGGSWGTVCDYFFGNVDANVICQSQNYTRSVCAVSNARLGRGRGDILITRLTCPSSAEILEDCTYTNYNRNSYSIRRNCRTNHYDDAGVICQPNEGDFLPAPRDFNATVSGTTVTFTWRRYIFPSYTSYRGQFRILYTRSDRNSQYSIFASYSRSSATLSYLPIGVTINATIMARGYFSRYSCYVYIDGDASETISVIIRETPPSSAPLGFHISVANCSAILAEWRPPLYSNLNGILRGYKLMYKPLGESEITMDLYANVTEYLIGGLKPSTSYTVSVLAYTIGDGPRSIHLTGTTNDETVCQTDIISFFGINGNDLDRYMAHLYIRSINVNCGSNRPNVTINWYYANGTRVGVSNRYLHEGHLSNGTSVLQIGNGRRVSICDAGIFICQANVSTNGNVQAQKRSFKLTYNSSPPTPQRPLVQKRDSNSATISWVKPVCDGGHDIQYYNVRVGYYRYSFYSGLTYRYIYRVDARSTNYTLVGLTARTTYYVAVQAVGKDATTSGYSSSSSFVTLPPAPTPPRYVVIKLVAPNIIMVTWTRPSVTNGDIAYYTVYATPIDSRTQLVPRQKRAAMSLQVLAKNFSSDSTSGNLTLPQLGVEYHIQMSVTVLDTASRTNRESSRSSLSSNSTLFVPIQGLPVPTNVRVSSPTNNSLTLSWNTPQFNGDTITGYLVEYSALVDGRSPEGTVISYTHQGNVTVGGRANSFIVQPLVPLTRYQLRVSTLTARGEGEQVTVYGTTASGSSEYERYVYFHVRFGPVPSCASFRRDIGGQENAVNKQIFDYLKKECNCSFTDANIETGFFSCGQKDHQIIYRAHILGTANYSATDLVTLLQNWILTNRAFVTLNNFRMQLDPTCPAKLDTLDDPECPIIDITTASPPTQTTPTIAMTTTKEPIVTIKSDPTPKDTEKPPEGGNKEGQVGGVTQAVHHTTLSGSSLAIVFVGLIIAFILLILIVLVIVVAFMKLRKSTPKPAPNLPVRNDSTNQSTLRFSELEKSAVGNNYEDQYDDDNEKLKDYF